MNKEQIFHILTQTRFQINRVWVYSWLALFIIFFIPLAVPVYFWNLNSSSYDFFTFLFLVLGTGIQIKTLQQLYDFKGRSFCSDLLYILYPPGMACFEWYCFSCPWAWNHFASAYLCYSGIAYLFVLADFRIQYWSLSFVWKRVWLFILFLILMFPVIVCTAYSLENLILLYLGLPSLWDFGKLLFSYHDCFVHFTSVLIPVSVALLLLVHPVSKRDQRFPRIYFLYLFLSIALILFGVSRNSSLREYVKRINQDVNICALLGKYQNSPDFYEKMKKEILHCGEDGMYLVLIDESAALERMQALARKKTDLFYARLKEFPGWILFDNAYTTCYLTDEALRYALSSVDPLEPAVRLSRCRTVFSFAAAAGYETSWITSQGTYEPNLAFLNQFSALSDRQVFFGEIADHDSELQIMDRKILEYLEAHQKEFFAAPRSLILLKPMGMHNPDLLLPEEFRKLHSEYSAYEQSLIFADDFLRKVFDWAVRSKKLKAFVYFSDHVCRCGEQEKEHLPFAVFLSPELRKERPELERELRVMAARPFHTAETYSLLLKVMNIKLKK